MIDPTDLNDPAKAEAYVREAIGNVDADIARLEAQTEKQIQKARERYAEVPDALQRYTRKLREILERQTAPMRQHREAMIRIIERVDYLRTTPPIIIERGKEN